MSGPPPYRAAPYRAPPVRTLTGVTSRLSARHRDPFPTPELDEGVHAHEWEVTAWWPGEPLRDARALRASLTILLMTLSDDDDLLPSSLATGEAIAQRVLLLDGCVGCRVTRANGIHAEAWLAQTG